MSITVVSKTNAEKYFTKTFISIVYQYTKFYIDSIENLKEDTKKSSKEKEELYKRIVQ